MKKFIVPASMYGDSHRYKNDKGEISMLYPSLITSQCYEIMCIDCELFDDIERYETLEEAEKRIYEVLDETIDIKHEVVEPLQISSGIECNKCKCNNGQDDHNCPYSEEINNDSESTCNCCENCEHECTMDI